jgi:hypothetical protein
MVSDKLDSCITNAKRMINSKVIITAKIEPLETNITSCNKGFSSCFEFIFLAFFILYPTPPMHLISNICRKES